MDVKMKGSVTNGIVGINEIAMIGMLVIVVIAISHSDK